MTEMPGGTRDRFDFTHWRHVEMDESNLTSESLIAQMTPEEICELLSEMGMETTEEQAAAIQRLIGELGSLEAAFDALQDDSDQADRAAA